ncbi:pyruvate carboxylase [Aerococcus kribbianus]|uniref:Pyruvate carboxylase n=1 Tax=Aerococcus kribbianus TaxID=2999064 RepID=A0A9X3JD85_9LACT|nr:MULTISPECIES: pyruvate carboxylase [unclassified Aerococcus]MCZ0717230.1 pyruvate carboxylase [Aerococcus sp. YH-aer221]MCZ0725518.1 pyruvate carboxylase [Aerococcus sp. YH-aer222]
MKKVLVANRGEIAIRVFRACFELGIETVAIYAKEDEASVHRFKADESYLVGAGKKPVEAYLDIEGIIAIAKDTGADAIHPGYGFLSENVHFARRCEEEGIIFIGPSSTTLDMFGDKVKARQAALDAEIPLIPGSDGPVSGVEEVYDFADQVGYPIMVKAALGGGGRGMRVVHSREELAEKYQTAQSEAEKAFGSGEMYVEKYIENPKHIEVQVIADQDGNTMHLWERDCSVQRRHQKVVEVAPTVSMTMDVRHAICNTARDFLASVGYTNAGTVEFLLDGEDFYFIEVNPRVQVEHTITEEITGVDIVQTQIRIADGQSLSQAGLPDQAALPLNGYAIQCRVTTEDPNNDFFPATGKVNTYRSPGGFGVRLDAGNGFQNTVITPYFDSMLTKLIVKATSFEDTVAKMNRSLREYRIRGVETNLPFVRNVINHEVFKSGQATTTFIDNTPELFDFPKSRNRDRGNKTLQYIGDTTINGFPGLAKQDKPYFAKAEIPEFAKKEADGPTAKQILDHQGVEAVKDYVKNSSDLLLTDTTMRDAHQSLIATRMRTRDMLKAAKVQEAVNPDMFSMEVWGGATFDSALRFLTEDPWQRLEALRAAMPNTLLQMLFRGANAVGYTSYPDNVLKEFIQQSAQSGIDVFRIFDSLNWTKQMENSIQYVKDTGKIAEATMCYTGDILAANPGKYNLKYYVDLAKELEKLGADILAIKDMAGLLKPQAAYALVSELKSQIDLPIHLHTHDTAGNGIMTYVKAAEAGVDVVDVATAAFSSTTSQPAMTSLYYAMEHSERVPKLDPRNSQLLNQYWSGVRHYYEAFNSGLKVPETEIYRTEMPGGQYTNLQQQAQAVNLGDRWNEVKAMYHDVNLLFGDIVKVTPSSKVVGDMALFMVQNDLSIADFYEQGSHIDFPQSVIDFFSGKLGQPAGGFPEDVKNIILKGGPASTERPGALLADVDFEATRQEIIAKLGEDDVDDQDVLSYLMYPDVFIDYRHKLDKYSDLSLIDTPTFFYGMKPGESVNIEIEKGKVLFIRLIQIGEVDHNGNRIMFFELNGQRREIVVADASYMHKVASRRKADKSNPNHIGATMPGSILDVPVAVGDQVKAGQVIVVSEAMKMETTIKAPSAGTIKDILVGAGDQIESGDLLIEMEK